MNRDSNASAEIADALTQIRSRGWEQKRAGVRALDAVKTGEADLALLSLLNHRSSDVRCTALELLVERKPDVARLAARAALSDDNVLVRNTAAEALGHSGNRLDHRRLEAALGDDNYVVRATVVDGLGLVAKKFARRALTHMLQTDPHPVVRRDAAVALAYSEDASVMPVLEAALEIEREEQARLGLFHALYALGQRARLADLLALFRSKDGVVRHAVLNSIRYALRPEDSGPVIHALKAGLASEENPGVRADTKLLLSELTERCPSHLLAR